MHFLEQFANWKFYLIGSYPHGEMGGLTANIMLAAVALLSSSIVSILLGYGRLSKNKFISLPCSWFIDIVRSIPLLMIVFWFYFFLPYIFGGHVTIFKSAAFALFIYASSYQAEIVRAGILAVPMGQMEAAMTIGLSKNQAMRYIIFPQAFKIMIPTYVSFFVSLFKDTSIAYIIGVVELTQSGVIVSQRQPDRIFAAYLCVAMGFWIVSFSMSSLAKMLEKRLGRLSLESMFVK